MQEHVNNGNRYLLVEPTKPEMYAESYHTSEDGHWLYQHTGLSTFAGTPLPPGQWQLIGLASQLTESEAGEVVEAMTVLGQPCYRDYRTINSYVNHITAIESLYTFLQSKSLNPSQTIIIKQV